VVDSWDHALTVDGFGALRSAAASLRQISVGLAEGELAIVCCSCWQGAHTDLCVGTIDCDSFEAYLKEGEEVLIDDPDPEDAGPDDEDSPDSVPDSGLIALLTRVQPTELGFALDGATSGGGYDDFLDVVRPRAANAAPDVPWQPAALGALFQSVFPPGRMEWSGGALHCASGSMGEFPLYYVAVADAAGNAAIMMMHFQYADGWREWRVSTDPLVNVSAAP